MLQTFENFLIFLNNLQEFPLAIGLIEGFLFFVAEILVETRVGVLVFWVIEGVPFESIYRILFMRD